MRPRPELTAAVRLPVVVFSAEGHAVEISALLLSEITGPCGTGLWKEDTLKKQSKQRKANDEQHRL